MIVLDQVKAPKNDKPSTRKINNYEETKTKTTKVTMIQI